MPETTVSDEVMEFTRALVRDLRLKGSFYGREVQRLGWERRNECPEILCSTVETSSEKIEDALIDLIRSDEIGLDPDNISLLKATDLLKEAAR